jgi:hypothetical protein
MMQATRELERGKMERGKVKKGTGEEGKVGKGKARLYYHATNGGTSESTLLFGA